MAIIYDPNLDFQVLDASIPEDEYETPSVDTSLGALFATFSSRGKHNKIIECRRTSTIKTTFGDDFGNWDKYGQTNLTALRVVKSGGRAFICSLIPNDAKVAYSTFGVSVMVIDTTHGGGIPVYERDGTTLNVDETGVATYGKGAFILDANGNKKQLKLKVEASDEEPTVDAKVAGFKLKVETRSDLLPNQFDANGYPTGFDGAPSTVQTSEGEYTFYPLFTVFYYSKGKGGNFFGYKISRNTSRDKKAVDGRRYTIKFYELLSTGSYKSLYDGEEFDFSLNPDAVYSSADPSSEALSKVYTNLDDQGEEKPLQLITYDNNFKTLVTRLKQNGSVEEYSDDLVDILSGVFQNGNPYNKIIMHDASIDIGNTIITLDSGTDGSLDPEIHTAEEIAAKKTELLIDFFKCDVDDDIFDEKIVDADILPDCNYSDDVKKVIMSTFSVYRPDIFLGVDLGITTSVGDAISKYRELSSYVNSDWAFMCAFFGHAGYLKDKEIDNSAREITCVYDWIGGMADNFATGNGAFQMHAGANRGRVKYITPYFVCKKNKSNDIETLENYGINNIQYLNKNKDLVYMLESTQYVVETSKLMSVRNALVIGRLIRMCAGILPYYKYDERNIADTLSEAKRVLKSNVSSARVPSTIQVDFDLYQTKADKKDENAHCAIEVKFPDYVKKFHVVITAKRQD